MDEPKVPNLQEKYWVWQREGLDLSFAFTQEIKQFIVKILTLFHLSDNPEIANLSKIEFENHDTFTSAWIDDMDRPCCAAMIDDGAPMGWRVEFLNIDQQHELHRLLQEILRELELGSEENLK